MGESVAGELGIIFPTRTVPLPSKTSHVKSPACNVPSPQQSRAGFLRTRGIMATTSNMFLYSLTIQPPTTISQALLGQFSGTKEQQIVTASGSRLTLLQPDPRQGKVKTLLSHDIFGIIRSIASFRLAGSHKGE
jgi:hypothetical protein